MKKLFFFAVLFGLLTGCSKENEKIPPNGISDKSFLDYLLANYDTDLDGFISLKEAEAVKVIDLRIEYSDWGMDESEWGTIHSLKGIEYFTNLETLFVSNQTLLETPDLSKNTGLKEFMWDNCGKGTEAIDLSKNSLLTFLQYGPRYNNEIDISNLTVLEHLQLKWGSTATSFKNNPLLKQVHFANWPPGGDLDFSNNTLLEDVYVMNVGELSVETKLNISNCKNLKSLYLICIGVREVDLQQADKLKEVLIHNCDSLNYLNLSGAINLETLELLSVKEAEINISDCKKLSGLTTLDVQSIKKLNASGCASIVTFYWNEDNRNRKLKNLDLSNCTSLTQLRCRYNSELEELNVKGCTALIELLCGGSFAKLDVSTCTSLRTLGCGAKLNELNVSGCKLLKEINCNGNELKELDVSTCESLENLFCATNQLQTLDLYECRALKSVTTLFNEDLKTITLYKNHKIEVLLCDDHTQIILKE